MFILANSGESVVLSLNEKMTFVQKQHFLPVFYRLKDLFFRGFLAFVSLSSTLKNLIRKIESHEVEKLSISNIYKKSGRNKKDKSELYTEIRSIMGNNNALTLKGCQEKLTHRVSLSQLSRDFTCKADMLRLVISRCSFFDLILYSLLT